VSTCCKEIPFLPDFGLDFALNRLHSISGLLPNCKKNVPASFDMSVCPHVTNKEPTADILFMKCYIGKFYRNLLARSNLS
jgi:hypothetical protein